MPELFEYPSCLDWKVTDGAAKTLAITQLARRRPKNTIAPISEGDNNPEAVIRGKREKRMGTVWKWGEFGLWRAPAQCDVKAAE